MTTFQQYDDVSGGFGLHAIVGVPHLFAFNFMNINSMYSGRKASMKLEPHKIKGIVGIEKKNQDNNTL